MKQILLLAFLLIAPILTKAQIPGYQGKRFFIEAGISFFPNIFAPSIEFNGSFSMKAIYSLSCNYVIGRKTVFRAGYTHQVAGMIAKRTYSNSSTTQYYLFLHDVNFAFDLYDRKKGNLAPLGFYFSPGLRFVFSQDELVNKNLSQTFPHPMVVMLGITPKLGYRVILFNRLTLNMAFEFTFFPQYLLSNHPVYLPIPAYEKEVIRIAADRYIFGIQVGIGVLLF